MTTLGEIQKDYSIYIGGFEVLPKKGSQFEKTGAKGAFLYCFCKSENLEEAERKMNKALSEDCYRIKEKEFVTLYNSQEFDESDQIMLNKLSDQASSCDDVIYSDFYTYDE